MINEVYECFFCGRGGVLHRHHCLHGSRRKAAERFDLTVYLCPRCHAELHDHGKGDLYLEQLAQTYFEARYGRKKYMEIFGKNYL